MERKVININGVLDDWGWLRSTVQYMLNKHKGEPVLCIVNSYGGNVNEGLAISKLFEEHGDVVVRFIGCCASAATWMAFGAKSIEIAEDALFLVHQCSNLVAIYKSMKVEDIDATIKKLESMKKSQEAINLTIAKKYADRIPEGKTLEDVLNLMAEERWMTAEETKEWGFVDTVIPGINRMTKEAQNLVAMNCASMNLPVPHFEEPKEEKSMVSQIIDGIKNLLHLENKGAEENTSEDPANHSTEKEQTVSNNQNNQSSMNKKFINLIALLAIANDATTDEEKGVTLTHEQLQLIENALANAKAKEKTLKDVEEALDAVSDNVKKMEGVKNKALALAGLVDKFPIHAPAGNKVAEGASDSKQNALDETAKDDINAEARNLYRPKK
ncbi:MAG: ATP-dependent Clp protease proteolytic subunit [Prevotellaceae bacterium]|nr:ATP-dependent Clp protease proteolytic subunit [Prevotellaceae bacterium]